MMRFFFSIIMFIFSQDILGENLKKRYIIKFKNKNGRLGQSALSRNRLIKNLSKAELKKLKESKKIDYIEEDKVLKAFKDSENQEGLDPLSYQQWNYFDEFGINLLSAWDIAYGLNDVVVAIVDTGITSHPDLNSFVIEGADLISDVHMANDGDGRDSSPQDPGDWISSDDHCGEKRASSWHGTHVAGIVAAKAYNGIGGVGVMRFGKILPVRVLGKCGGMTSDIADGIRWAAGGQVEGLSPNKNPAKVINLSLGGSGVCSRYMQEAIDFARKKGAVVVVAAGNSSLNMDFFPVTPASCRGVLTVASSNQEGGLSYFSNYGSDVGITAPGGGYESGILSTINSGETIPHSFDYGNRKGTSMSAPHIAGLAGLIFSLSLDFSPDQVIEIIKDSGKIIEDEKCFLEKCRGLVDAEVSLVLAESIVPDPNYRSIGLVVGDEGGGKVEKDNHRYNQLKSDKRRWLSCGTVYTEGTNLGDGGPPWTGLFTVLLGGGLMVFGLKRRSLKRV